MGRSQGMRYSEPLLEDIKDMNTRGMFVLPDATHHGDQYFI